MGVGVGSSVGGVGVTSTATGALGDGDKEGNVVGESVVGESLPVGDADGSGSQMVGAPLLFQPEGADGQDLPPVGADGHDPSAATTASSMDFPPLLPPDVVALPYLALGPLLPPPRVDTFAVPPPPTQCMTGLSGWFISIQPDERRRRPPPHPAAQSVA